MKKIVFFILVLLIITFSYNIYARYILNITTNLKVNSAPFYFNVGVSSSYIEQKNNEANMTLNIKNFISDTEYDKFDTKYNIQVTSSKYKITVTDANNGILTGNEKKTNSINVKFEPIDSTVLTLEELVTIVITTSSPYVKQITESITIKNSDILYNVGVVSGGYSTNIDTTGIVGWQSLNAENLFLDITSIEVPDYAKGTMNFSKLYNSSTGIFTINRTSIWGPGFIIQFNANIYASFQPVLVGNVTGDYKAVIDCTGVTDWQKRTVDDFILDVKWVDLPDEIMGTMYFSKSYNASTGQLTINRSSITGNGTVTFNTNIYTTRFPSQVTKLNEANLAVTSTEDVSDEVTTASQLFLEDETSLNLANNKEENVDSIISENIINNTIIDDNETSNTVNLIDT